MPTRSAAVLTSGTTTAAKLFVAALAFTSAYVGLSAYSNASSTPEPTTQVTLSARELPISAPAEELATAGKVTVSVLTDGGAGCAKSYVARSLVANPDPAAPVSYHWRLARWSPSAKAWRTYLADHDGFAAPERTVEWRPQVSGNPGWYRVELTIEGAEPIRSDRFQASC
ncbi:hypothetical protein HD597_012258 [Nonomuraea thailandensis]|uniref:Uncharacterized protein n=1 Tax=Nonomuraea thailandensis TaxID=1188745 RepID=A0A9X2H283_9ACTN|nr:hypothetical protein [Nonomuraea thailandensis]MCP2365238.1 hypothetical protein [Nonomuraea thailandensis]